MDNKFIPYYRVSNKEIENISTTISKINKNALKQMVLNEFTKYLGDIDKDRIPKFSIKIESILDIKNSLVVVNFKDKLYYSDGEPYSIAGMAHLLKTNDGKIIPTIYLSTAKNPATFKHEIIHIYQYLQKESYPLTERQKSYLLENNFINALKNLNASDGKNKALEFIINVVCYSTWIEIEAEYHTVKHDYVMTLLEKSYSSSLPFDKLKYACQLLGCDENNQKETLDKYEQFCNLLQNEVGWLKALITKDYPSGNLYDLICQVHDVMIRYQ
jgi:hypothetical protein